MSECVHALPLCTWFAPPRKCSHAASACNNARLTHLKSCHTLLSQVCFTSQLAAQLCANRRKVVQDVERCVKHHCTSTSRDGADQLRGALQRFVSQNVSPSHSQNYTAAQRDNMGAVLHILQHSSFSQDTELVLLALTVRYCRSRITQAAALCRHGIVCMPLQVASSLLCATLQALVHEQNTCQHIGTVTARHAEL